MKKIITCLMAMIGLTSACGQQSYENTDVKIFAQLMENADVVFLDVRC